MRERYNSADRVRRIERQLAGEIKTRKAFFQEHNGLDSSPSTPDNSSPSHSFAKSAQKANLHALPGQTLRLSAATKGIFASHAAQATPPRNKSQIPNRRVSCKKRRKTVV